MTAQVRSGHSALRSFRIPSIDRQCQEGQRNPPMDAQSGRCPARKQAAWWNKLVHPKGRKPSPAGPDSSLR